MCITHFNSRSIASHRQVVLWCQLKAVTVKGRLNYFEFQPRYNPKDFRTTYLFRWLAARKERGWEGGAAQWLIFSGISQVCDALHFDKNVTAKTPASWRNRCLTLISKSFGFFAREIWKLAAEFSKGKGWWQSSPWVTEANRWERQMRNDVETRAYIHRGKTQLTTTLFPFFFWLLHFKWYCLLLRICHSSDAFGYINSQV